MRIITSILICGILFLTTSFSSQYNSRNYIKRFVNDVIELDDQPVFNKYFIDVKDKYVVEFYSGIFEGIRTYHNPKKKILIEKIENRIYKILLGDSFIYIKLKKDVNAIEGFAIRKGERIMDWITVDTILDN